MDGDAYGPEYDQQRAARDERIRGERGEDGAGWGAKSDYFRSLPTGALSSVGDYQVAEYRADATSAGRVPRTAFFSPANAACDDDDHHGALSWAPVDDCRAIVLYLPALD